MHTLIYTELTLSLVDVRVPTKIMLIVLDRKSIDNDILYNILMENPWMSAIRLLELACGTNSHHRMCMLCPLKESVKPKFDEAWPNK